MAGRDFTFRDSSTDRVVGVIDAILRQLGSDRQGQGFGGITSRTFPPSGTSEICRCRSPRKETCSYRSTT
jgi:hypothetical protein